MSSHGMLHTKEEAKDIHRNIKHASEFLNHQLNHIFQAQRTARKEPKHQLLRAARKKYALSVIK